jgi:hypothetical protein
MGVGFLFFFSQLLLFSELYTANDTRHFAGKGLMLRLDRQLLLHLTKRSHGCQRVHTRRLGLLHRRVMSRPCRSAP